MEPPPARPRPARGERRWRQPRRRTCGADHTGRTSLCAIRSALHIALCLALGLAASACRPTASYVDRAITVTADGGTSRTELLEGNVLAFRSPLLPLAGGDADRDGLNDAWEDAVLERFKPALRFDEHEPIVDDTSAVLAYVGRVTPVKSDPSLVRVFIMLGYSIDYGSCGVTAHNGDSERVALELSLGGSGAGDAQLKRAYTAAHEGADTDRSRRFETNELGQLRFVQEQPRNEPRWVVFPSSSKHGTYANPRLCEDMLRAPCFAEYCHPDTAAAAKFDALPPIYNAGEPESPRLAELDAIGFPGDHAWKDQKFCGGLGTAKSCSSSVLSKLTVDPFE